MVAISREKNYTAEPGTEGNFDSLTRNLIISEPKADPDPLYSDLAGSGPILETLENKKLQATKGKLFLRIKSLT
jgi:hypothetical protein